MLKNYFKTAWRSLSRNTVYSLINIAGLTIGLACAILIMLYVKDEVSFDRFHRNVGQIYRIDKQQKRENGSIDAGSYTGYFPGPRFAARIPEIQSYVRFQPNVVDINTGRDIQSQSISLVDTNFFSLFNFPLISGNPKTVLTQPNSVVVSEETAKKYFGTLNVVGKTLSIKEQDIFVPYLVSGVAKNCPQNSSIQFEMVLPLQVSLADESNNDNWFNSFLTTFVVLAPHSSVASVQDKMNKVFLADASPAISAIKAKYGIKNIGTTYELEPLTAIHLGSEVSQQDEILSKKSNPTFSYILSAIALFILLIACMNFVNLTVARSVKRAKEIGLRKVIGSTRNQLIVQFLSESFALSLLAFGLAIIVAIIVLPMFNQLSNKELSLSYLLDTKLIIGFVLLLIATALLAGFYPALVLSNYHPVDTLYSRFKLAGKNYLQKSLVIFQFTLATFLIIGTIVIFLQFHYLTSQSLGYDDRNLIEVQKPHLSRNEATLLKQVLLKSPDIIGVAPKNLDFSNNTVKLKGDKSVNVVIETIDPSYLPLLKVPVILGRNFSTDYPSDSMHSVLVNEAFVEEAGWKQPLYQQVTSFENGRIYNVVGVVKDYHYKPLTQSIGPQLFTMDASASFGQVDIKIKAGKASSALAYVAKTFKSLFPLSPFIYGFKQEENEQGYAVEAKWKQIILFSALLTIFISCIGLFGLTVLSAEKRTKEIGIRKVLGASVGNILSTLSIEFLRLIFISLMVSVPLAWIAANKWLENYPYRIELSWWLFALSGLLVILVAMGTVSFQSIKAAMASPVKNLRSE